jgi:hypothetical protein
MLKNNSQELADKGCELAIDGLDNIKVWEVLCAAKDETSVDIMGRMFCCNFLRKSRL